MKVPIYFDYAATTPVDPRVAQKMSECLMTEGKFGNPASRSHKFGWEAEEAVEIARRQVADLVNCDPREIVWTSGATESDNLAIKGVAYAKREEGNHIVTSSIEHSAVLNCCQYLEEQGFEVTYLPVDRHGLCDPRRNGRFAAVRAAVADPVHDRADQRGTSVRCPRRVLPAVRRHACGHLVARRARHGAAGCDAGALGSPGRLPTRFDPAA